MTTGFERMGVGHEAEQLQSLQSITRFNEAMKQLGKLYRLAHDPNGGYVLEADGVVVASIPECSEGRAAWCAYYYVRGLRIADWLDGWRAPTAGTSLADPGISTVTRPPIDERRD